MIRRDSRHRYLNDDTSVSIVSPEVVKRSCAYVVFYRRRPLHDVEQRRAQIAAAVAAAALSRSSLRPNMPVSALAAQSLVRFLLPCEFRSHLITVRRSGSPRCGCCGCRCPPSQLLSCSDRTSRPVQHLSSPGPLRLAEFMCSHGQVRASFRARFAASYDLSLMRGGSGGCEGAAKEVSAMSLHTRIHCTTWLEERDFSFHSLLLPVDARSWR